MCYSLAGRVQTRLLTLLAPALVTVFVLERTGDERYLTMFIIVVVLSIDLDIAIYSRLIGYQARWITYSVGIIEFFLTLWIVRGLGGTLPLNLIIEFYVVSWLGAQLIVNVVLPVLDPLWVEHGGEFGRPAIPHPQVVGRFKSVTSKARGYITNTPVESLTLAALVFLVTLQLTVLPTTLVLVDVVASLGGSVVAGALVNRFNRRLPLAQILILGLLMSLLVRATSPWPYLLGGAAAVAACGLLRIEGRPVLNGAAFALVAVAPFVPGAYSSEAEWGNSLLLPLIIANLALLIALQSRRAILVTTFFATILIHAFLFQHVTGDWLQVVAIQVRPPWLIFFGGFVLSDASTSPEEPVLQLAAGAGVAALGLGLQGLGVGLAFPMALLAWNYASRLLSAGILGYKSLRSLIPGRAAKRSPYIPAHSRRVFLGTISALAASVFLGGALRRLTSVDPAVLSLPPDPVLAGGQAIPRFRDVSSEAGIVLAHHADPQVGSPAIGTGVAWGDYDMDGKLDLYVTDQMGACHLYRNNGDGTFTDVALGAGVENPGQRATSATFVDYDNDGWPDLYVGLALDPDILYHNNGDGTFTNVTAKSGFGSHLGRTMCTAWADYDGDGFLDFFVANYPTDPVALDANISIIEDLRTVKRLPQPHNRLYHNNGDGTFTDVTNLLDPTGFGSSRGFGFSAVWFDYNRDGRPDLYVAYDFGSVVVPNTLWRNDGPGPHGWRFTQVEHEMGVAVRKNTMGVASGDYNNDGWLDLAITNIGPNFLYQNRPKRPFVDRAEQAGVTHARDTIDNMLNPSMTWGVDFADFNNDGWLDLYLVAGSMDFENIPQPNSLYLNDHAGRFVDVSGPSGTNDSGQGRSVAIGDFDGDGYLDMFIANYGQPPLLYRNLSRSTGNHWLQLKLEGTRSNRDAVGARVTLFGSGVRLQTREVQIGQGLGSCDAKELHFGLGTMKRAERVEIRWPSGLHQILRGVEADRVVHVREPGKSRWTVRKA